MSELNRKDVLHACLKDGLPAKGVLALFPGKGRVSQWDLVKWSPGSEALYPFVVLNTFPAFIWGNVGENCKRRILDWCIDRHVLGAGIEYPPDVVKWARNWANGNRDYEVAHGLYKLVDVLIKEQSHSEYWYLRELLYAVNVDYTWAGLNLPQHGGEQFLFVYFLHQAMFDQVCEG